MLDVFRTEPLLLPKIWGGRKLETVFGKDLPDDQPYGESWEVADLPEGQSRVANGEHAGKTLRQMCEQFGEEFYGKNAADGRFPLLVKLLDAAADLSIQVHPSHDNKHLFDGAKSKDECWLFLDCDENGSVLHGFKSGVDAAAFSMSVDDGTVVELMRRFNVVPGQSIRVSPGTVHAICGGVSLLEIQEPSDTTFRVYDYGRPGLDGNPRALHVHEATAVAKFKNDETLKNAGDSLSFETAAYQVCKLENPSRLTLTYLPKNPVVVCALHTTVEVNNVVLEPYQTAIVPACIETLSVESPGPVVLATNGEPFEIE